MYKILLYFYFLTLINCTTIDKLIFASLHSRHGARAPLDCDSNQFDFLGEKWTNPGELTPTGQRMEYILGLRNHQRYIVEREFLSENFDPHEILVYSTNVNRTILSMASQLQGLYPMYKKYGEKLSKEQQKVAYPPVNISEETKEEVGKLNDSALPNYMTIIPIRTLLTSDRKMNVQDSSGCKDKVNKTRDYNKVNKEILKYLSGQFNQKYSENLGKFYDKNPKGFKYDFDWIGLFCDTLVSDYSDGRKMEDFFKRTEIKQSELLKDCREIIYHNFKDDFYGDDKGEVILLAESNLIKEVLHYMKLKIDEDISGKNSKNASDYSKPKMLIYSGHDSTLSGEELFMLKYFGLGTEHFRYPNYTTQFAFEVTKDGDIEDLKYTSYNVSFYINEELIFSRNFEEFKKTIENNVWSAEQISEFCEDSKNPENPENPENSDKSDKSEDNFFKDIQLYLLIGIGCLVFIFIIIIICLAIKLKNLNNNSAFSDGDDEDKDKGLMNEDEHN